MTKYLRRYTNLPALIYLLKEQKITLLDPIHWDDKNDSYFLSLYQERKKVKSVLALCFSQAPETYHHWRVFADGSSGACIRFNRAKLLKAIKKQPGVRSRAVTYLKVSYVEGTRAKIDQLPFLKRAPYEHEDEFRILYESETTKEDAVDIAIPLSSIDQITLSPWIPSALFKDVSALIRKIDKCGSVKVLRSSLISNERWKAFGDTAA